jgi:hypothetical protein
VKHARRSLRWALVAAIASTGIPILYFFSTASRWFTVGAAGYAVFMWATFLLQRRAYRAAFGEGPANVR